MQLNIELRRESGELIVVQYFRRESVGLNIELQRESGELIGIQYWTTEGVRWADESSILNSGGSSVG